jgi:hypothetical protein
MVLSVVSAMNRINFWFMWLLAPMFLYFTRVFKNKKILDIILLIYGVFLGLILLIVDILAIKSWSHGLLVIMLLPLPIYLGKILKTKIKEGKNNKKIVEEKISEKEEAEIDGKIIDYSKRNFLKFLAGSGVASLVMFLFSKKNAHAAFFGSVPGPGTVALKNSSGDKIDPAVNSPTDGYGICDISSGTINYYGYINKDGSWYILKEDTENNNFSYASNLNNGSVSVYSSAWSAKDSTLVFGSFNQAF